MTTTATPQPKVKSMQAKGDKKGKDGGKGQNSHGKGKSKDDAKGKGKKGKREPCTYFSSEEGCKFGQTRKGYHRMLKPDEYKCFVRGSAKHLASECERPKKDGTNQKGTSKGDDTKKGGKGSKGKSDGGKGKPTVNSITK